MPPRRVPEALEHFRRALAHVLRSREHEAAGRLRQAREEREQVGVQYEQGVAAELEAARGRDDRPR